MVIAHSCVLLLASFVLAVQAANFAECRRTVESFLPLLDNDRLDTNATITNASFADPIYHGQIRGFHLGPEDRPITPTVAGCKQVCGSGSEPNNVVDAFQIITTWVLPAIALLGQLPYESLSSDRWKNLEALCNWMGAPAAALTTTLWNILMISKCRVESMKQDTAAVRHALNDSLYVLSCINQYQYPRRSNKSLVDRRRDRALLRGVLAPYLDVRQMPTEELRNKLRNITSHLAFQLRLQRRRGVWPLWFSLFGFLLALIFSIVIAFDTSLGDNSTAHSLALGLLLSWLPVVVVAAIIDRNPVSATRCGVLIQRWLCYVDRLFEEEGALSFRNLPRPSIASQTSSNQLLPPNNADPDSQDEGRSISSRRSQRSQESRSPIFTPIQPSGSTVELEELLEPEASSVDWRDRPHLDIFDIGDFVGQGRRMRYCAVTDTVLSMIEREASASQRLPDDDQATAFRANLTKRPLSWYVVWVLSWVIVTFAYAAAFVVSFKTPTMGLGCRSLSYTIWYALNIVPWFFLGLRQEPPRWMRIAACIFSGLATLALLGIMMLQVSGGLNNCVCKSSIFGSRAYGGYMDFENGPFYQKAYDVVLVWGLASGFGFIPSLCTLYWLAWRFAHDKILWKVNEASKIDEMVDVDLTWLS